MVQKIYMNPTSTPILGEQKAVIHLVSFFFFLLINQGKADSGGERLGFLSQDDNRVLSFDD
jgi:hypothetical protein